MVSSSYNHCHVECAIGGLQKSGKSIRRGHTFLTAIGYCATVTYANKMRGAAELCRAEGLKFIPIVAESLGGFHSVAVEQLKKIASALARHSAQDESEAIHHLLSRCSLLLQRGTAALLLNRVPSHPTPAESAVE